MADADVKPALRPRERTTPAPAGRPWPEGTPVLYVLRTADGDRLSRGGFQWPESGPVACPDWSPVAECGRGLHGIPWGVGDLWLLALGDAAATWQVVEVVAAEAVEIFDKVKFPRGFVCYSGAQGGAMALLADRRLLAYAATGGKYSPVSSSGKYSPVSSSGYTSPVSSSGKYSPVSSSGDESHAKATGANCPVAALGRHARVMAGPGGAMAAVYYDAAGRPRFAVGHVGDGGIEAGVWYEADPATGTLKRCDNQ